MYVNLSLLKKLTLKFTSPLAFIVPSTQVLHTCFCVGPLSFANVAFASPPTCALAPTIATSSLRTLTLGSKEIPINTVTSPFNSVSSDGILVRFLIPVSLSTAHPIIPFSVPFKLTFPLPSTTNTGLTSIYTPGTGLYPNVIKGNSFLHFFLIDILTDFV